MSEDVELEGKKLEIVKYAFGRLYENGFHATSMEAKRTLYKYFPSKEDLIEAVLTLYSEAVVQQLFGPVAHISDPREQIVAFFDVRKVAGRMLTRGCLGVKAAQEYAGKDADIVALGRCAASLGETKFLELCKQASLAEPARVAKQLNLIFQGALSLSHTLGDTSPFMLAKDMASTVLDNAAAARRKGMASKH